MRQVLVRIILIAALAALALPVLAQPVAPSGPAKQAGKSPVKVFILAGQSNMQGQGVTGINAEFRGKKGTLVAMLDDPAKAPLIKHLRNDKGEWVARDDVWVYDINEFGTRKGNLSFGFGWNLRDTTWFGLELQFGHVVKSQIANQVLIIKTARHSRLNSSITTSNFN